MTAGKAGADYKLNDKILHSSYKGIFNDCPEVNIEGPGKFASYPNRDSLSYIPIYKLENAQTFLRTTLRHPAFCTAWNAIVQADLANDLSLLNTEGLTYRNWSTAVTAFANEDNCMMLDFLGLFSEE